MISKTFYLTNEASLYNDFYVFGTFACLFLAVNVPVNLMLIWTILRNKTLRTSINYLISGLAACNLLSDLFPTVYSECVQLCIYIYLSSVYSNGLFAVFLSVYD